MIVIKFLLRSFVDCFGYMDKYYMMQTQPATAIAYPLDPNASTDSFYSLGLAPSNFTEDSVELGGNFFSQVCLVLEIFMSCCWLILFVCFFSCSLIL